MALTYRALLIPTAALDSSGSAKPDAVFSVTPMAGGSPAAVYGAAQGGSALAADQIKTDTLGNISGLYVAEPGPYALSFTGGGMVVTSAVMDSRDVATSGDLADALAGSASQAVPDYSYDGTTGLWTVAPGLSPGCAQFRTAADGYSDPVAAGGWAKVPVIETLHNPDVASLQEDGSIGFAAAGLYLIAAHGTMGFDSGTAGAPETLVSLGCSGGSSFAQSWSNVHPDLLNTDGIFDFSMAMPVLCDNSSAFNLTFDLHAVTYSWNTLFHLTIVRLD